MTQLLGAPVPSETVATCHACVMLPDQCGANGFAPDTKCCTYTPKLPPFLVGQILAASDADQPGRRSVIARIDARTGVTPLGVFPGPQAQLTAASFGRAPAHRCPHYLAEVGQCGVWKYRNAVCSTWFCRHDRGAVGSGFWEAADAFLRAVENELAAWCALELGIGADVLDALADDGDSLARGESSRPRLQAQWSDAAYAEVWGAWCGREREYFSACAARVRELDLARVFRVGGSTLATQGALVVEAHARLSAPRPDPLVPGPAWDVRDEPNGSCSMITYSGYDRLRIPRVVLALLPQFDGRPTAEVLGALASEHAVDVAPDELDRLVDFAALVGLE